MDLPNPNRINLEDRADVLLWADLLSIPVERLLEIAARVGPMAAAVRFYAAKTAGDTLIPRVAPSAPPPDAPDASSAPLTDAPVPPPD